MLFWLSYKNVYIFHVNFVDCSFLLNSRKLFPIFFIQHQVNSSHDIQFQAIVRIDSCPAVKPAVILVLLFRPVLSFWSAIVSSLLSDDLLWPKKLVFPL